MKVHEIASKPVFSVQPHDSIDAAIALMEEHAFHHLPVVSDGSVVGMVSDRDVLVGVGWRLSCDRQLGRYRCGVAGPERIEQIMSSPAITVAPSDSVATATGLLVRHRIGALPVVNRNRLLALLSETDVLRAVRNRTLDCSWQPGLLEEPVSEHMYARVITVRPRDPLADAVRIFREKHVRHLPVVVSGTGEEEILIGIVSDRDVRRALGDAAIRDDQARQRGDFCVGPTMVMDVMTTGARTIERSQTIGMAIELMLMYRIHSLPVLFDRALVGIITETDILRPLGMMERA